MLMKRQGIAAQPNFERQGLNEVSESFGLERVLACGRFSAGSAASICEPFWGFLLIEQDVT